MADHVSYYKVPPDVAKAYNETVPLAIRLCRTFFGLKTFEFEPSFGSPLSIQALSDPISRTVKLVADFDMCLSVLGLQCWQVEELDFAIRICQNSGKFTLVDVGAHVGLFARQMLVALQTSLRCLPMNQSR